MFLRDASDSIRFLHVAAELRENLIEGHTCGDRKSKFKLDPLSDLVGDLFTTSHHHRGACDIQPALVHAEGFHLIGVVLVDLTSCFRELHIFFVMRRNNHKILALLLGLPDGFTGAHAECFGFVVLRQHDSVPFFRASADRYRIWFQLWIEEALHGGVEVIHVTMQDCSFHNTSIIILSAKYFKKLLTKLRFKCILYVVQVHLCKYYTPSKFICQ